MPFEIIFAPEAARQVERIRAYDRVAILKGIERHLRHEPKKISKSRIKRLRAMRHPQYRLRIGDIRIFYDLNGDEVEIVAIISKKEAIAWLEKRV